MVHSPTNIDSYTKYMRAIYFQVNTESAATAWQNYTFMLDILKILFPQRTIIFNL